MTVSASVISKLPRPLTGQAAQEYFGASIWTKDPAIWFNNLVSSSTRGGGDLVYRIAVDAEGAVLPWEFLIKEIRHTEDARCRRQVAIVRSTPRLASRSPRRASVHSVAEPLRWLLATGDPEGALEPLDFPAEERALLAAWQNLAPDLQERVAQPRIEEAHKGTFSAMVQANRPHVLVFSGHGYFGRKVRRPGLRFRGGEIVSSREFADMLAASGHVPKYVIFLACDSATAAESGEGRPGNYGYPELFENLGRVGVHAMLGMQAPVLDSDAIVLSRGLLQYIALGLPLEIALARARGDLLLQQERRGYVPWAIPVAWSMAPMPDSIEWNTDSVPIAQIFGQCLLNGDDRLGRGLAPVHSDAPEPRQFAAWSEHQRLWLAAVGPNPGTLSKEEYLYLGRFVTSLQKRSQAPVLPLVAGDGSPEEEVRQWAEKAASLVPNQDMTVEYSRALHHARVEPASGLRRLLRDFDHRLVVVVSLGARAREWLDFLGDIRGWVVVMASEGTADAAAQGWRIDEVVPSEVARGELGATGSDFLAWCLIDLPLLAGDFPVGWPVGEGDLERVAFATSAGHCLRAVVRAEGLRQATPAQRFEACQRAAGILGQTRFRLDDHAAELRINLLLQARSIAQEQKLQSMVASDDPVSGLLRQATDLALPLADGYHARQQPAAMKRLAARFPATDTAEIRGVGGQRMGAWLLLRFAWGRLRDGQVQHAAIFLQRANLNNEDLETAWSRALQAEVWKNRGDREKAMQNAAEAVRLAAIARDKGPDKELALLRWLSYRQDEIRIRQYLYYERAEAVRLYDELLAGWPAEHRNHRDRAVVLRNLCEARRVLARPGDREWAMARQELATAARLLEENHPGDGLRAELLYEEAQFLGAEGQSGRSRETLDRCIRLAERTGNHLVSAIARNRLFWQDEFHEGDWEKIAIDLRLFPTHGWPVRALVDGLINAAEHQMKAGRKEAAWRSMEEASNLMKCRPGFVHGTDARRRGKILEFFNSQGGG